MLLFKKCRSLTRNIVHIVGSSVHRAAVQHPVLAFSVAITPGPHFVITVLLPASAR